MTQAEAAALVVALNRASSYVPPLLWEAIEHNAVAHLIADVANGVCTVAIITPPTPAGASP